jgi:signal transduction histidine kinase
LLPPAHPAAKGCKMTIPSGKPEESDHHNWFSLAIKGNLMVAVPLIFMLAFAYILTGEINQAELSRAQLSRDRELLSLGTRIGYLYQRAFASVYFISLLAVDNPVVLKKAARRYRQAEEAMLACARELKTEVRASSALRLEDAVALNDCTKTIAKLMHQAVYEVPKEQRFGFLTVNGPTFLGLSGKLDAVIGPLRKSDSASPAIMSGMYNKMLFTIQSGLVAGVIMALALAGYFSADVSRRLKLLAENVRRFGAGLELAPSRRGADEISELDQSFRRAVNQLHEAEQTKQRFFAAVTCDMEAPIEKVRKTVASLLQGEQGELSAAATSRLTTVQNNLMRITLLVQDLEGIEQLETGKLPLEKSLFKAQALLMRTGQMLESAAHSRRISIAIEAADLELIADEKRLSQILLNFLSNALKYSPDGATITLRCRGQGDKARFEVCDTGSGIAAEAQKQLFQKFQQVSLSDTRRGKGTGLGLSVSKLIAESHGGELGVESEPGKGSTFWFTVPLT